MKKVISLLLSVLICINTLPVQVWAEDENTIEDVKEEIVEVVEDKQEDITNQIIEEQSTENVEEVLVVDEEQDQDQEEIIIEEEIKDTNVENTNSDVQPKPMMLGASPKPLLGLASGWTAPTPISGLVYDRKQHNLFNAGSTTKSQLGYSFYFVYSEDNSNFNKEVISKTDAGAYTIYFKGNKHGNILGDNSDVSNTSGSIKVEISPATINKVSIINNKDKFIDNGSEQGPDKSDLVVTTSNGLTLTTDEFKVENNKKSSEGKYTLTVSPADGNTNFTGSATVDWSIEADNKSIGDATITINKTFTYNGSDRTITAFDFDVDYDGTGLQANIDYQIKDDVLSVATGKDAKTYSVILEGIGDYNGETTVDWTIAKAQLKKPKLKETSYNFTGKTFTVELNSDFNEDLEIIKENSNLSASAAGNYTVTVSINDKTNYEWQDGGNEDLDLTWNIVAVTPKASNDDLKVDEDWTVVWSEIRNSKYDITDTFVDAKSLNESVATVTFNKSGTSTITIHGVREGEAIIECNGNNTRGVLLKVKVSKNEVAVPTIKTGLIYTGTEQTGVNYSTSDPYTYTNVAATNVGEYTATFTLTNTDKYEWTDGSIEPKEKKWSISPSSKLSLNVESGPYILGINTSPIYTVSGVEVTEGSYETLTEDDYSVEYYDSIPTKIELNSITAAGTYTVKITGKRNYTGTKEATWTVSEKKTEITVNDITITNPTYEGSGINKVPTIAVKVNSKDLIKDVDYTIEDLTAVDVHSTEGYTFVLKGKGSYTTENPDEGLTLSWNVDKASIAVPTAQDLTYNGEVKYPFASLDSNITYVTETDIINSATAAGTYNAKIALIDSNNYKWSNDTFDGIVSWTIKKAKLTKPSLDNTSFDFTGGNHSVTINNFDSTNEQEADSNIKEASEVGTYNVVVKLKDTNNYEWSDSTITDVVLSWTINDVSVAKTINITVGDTNDETSWPSIRGNFNTSSLSSVESLNPNVVSTDIKEEKTFGVTTRYIVVKGDNAGTAIVKCIGSDNSTKYIKVIVAKRAITASLDEDVYIADGSDKAPIITVVDDNGKDLIEGVGFEIASGSTTKISEPGDYHIYIVGKGNYTTGGSPIDLPWSIKEGKIEIQATDITVTNKTYNATAQTPDVSVVVNGKTLVEDTDYTVSVEAQTEHNTDGNYTLSVSAKGDKYTTSQTIEKEWNINQLDISNVTITPSITSVTYDTTERTFNVTLKVGEATVSSSNYEIGGDVKKTNAGNYTATITPKQSLKGDAKLYDWKITKAQISNEIINSVKSTGKHTYDGKQYVLIKHDALPEGCTFYSGIGERDENIIGEDDRKPETYQAGEVSATNVNIYLLSETYYPVYWYIDGGINYENVGSASKPKSKVETTINKANPNLLTARTGLVYNPAGNLLVEGASSDVKYLYITQKDGESLDLNDQSKYTDKAPTASDAGKYYVTYLANADFSNSNYNVYSIFDISEHTVTVIIDRYGKDVETYVKPTSPSAVTYDGVTEFSNGYTVPDGITLKEGGVTKATNVGTYNATYVPDKNHCWKDGTTDEVTITLTINKADATVSQDPSLIENTTYNGGSINLLAQAAEASGGSVEYAVTTTDSAPSTGWAATALATDAGTYYVYYRVVGDDNHNNIDAKKIGLVEIEKATSTITTVPTAVTGLTYDTTSKVLINAGSSSTGSKIQYKLGSDGTYGDDVPTAKNAGSYDIYYKVVGDKNHTDIEEAGPISVTIDKASVTKPQAVNDLIYNKQAQTGVTVAEHSSRASGDEISQTDAGSYTSVIKLEDSNYKWSDNTTDNITVEWSIAKAVIDTVTLKQSSFDYDSEKKHPTITLVKAGSLVLSSEDYETTDLIDQTEKGEYSFNISSNNSNVIVKEGLNPIQWSIVGQGIGGAVITIDPREAKVEYDGKQKEITVGDLIVVLNDTTLTSDDYSITSGNTGKDADTYTLVLSGKGNYEGTASTTWQITKKTIGVTWPSVTSYTYTGSEITINATADGVVEGDSVLLNVQTNATAKDVKSYTATASFASSQKNYELDSSKTTYNFTIERAGIDVPTAITDLTFNRNIQTGVATGDGYTLANNTATNAGDYTATASVDSNHKWNDGTTEDTEDKDIAWSISPATITSVTLNSSEFNYDKNSHLPSVTEVKAGALTLADTEYDVSNNEAKASIGEYKITVTGKDNFTGSKDVSWSIKDTKDLSLATVTYIGGTKTFTGSDISVTSADFKVEYDGRTLDSSEYTISENATQINAGTYSATISTAEGKGWINSAKCDWKINPKSISGAKIENTSLEYTGENQYPVIKLDNITLIDQQDFQVSWPSDLKNVTSIDNSKKFTGIGNYTGEVTLSWKIVKASVTKPTSITGLSYTGSKQTGVKDYTSDLFTLESGTIEETNAGSYTAKFTLKDKNNYQWLNGNSNDLTVDWSIAKATPSVTAKELTFTGEPQDLVTTNPELGSEVTFNFTDVDWGTVISDAFDGYNTTIPQRTDAKTYTVYWYTIKTTNYNGYDNDIAGKIGALRQTVNVTIAPADLVSLEIDSTQETYSYNGNAQVPTLITVKGVEADGNLTNDSYTLSYYQVTDDGDVSINASDIKDVGTYKVVATGKGNYTNTVSDTWEITKANAPVPTAISPLTFDGNEKDLVSVVDSTIGYSFYVSTTKLDDLTGKVFNETAKGTNKGTYYVYWIADGNSNYNSSAANVNNYVEVNITAPQIDSVTVNNNGVFTYTGEEIKPTIEVKAGDLVVDTTNYKIQKNNTDKELSEIEVGEYTYTVVGINNVEGSKEFTFEIIPDIKVEVDTAEDNDYRKVAYNVNLETKKIEFTVTPKKDNTYVESVVVNKKTTLLTANDNTVELTYNNQGVASGSYTIEGVSSGEYTIVPTINTVTYNSNPKYVYINGLTSVSEADVKKAILTIEVPEDSDNKLNVKYDASLEALGYKYWQSLDYEPSSSLLDTTHSFGQPYHLGTTELTARDKEDIQITGTNKYAKVNITTSLALVDDRKSTTFDGNSSITISYDPAKTLKELVLEQVKLYEIVSGGENVAISDISDIYSLITITPDTMNINETKNVKLSFAGCYGDTYKYKAANDKTISVSLVLSCFDNKNSELISIGLPNASDEVVITATPKNGTYINSISVAGTKYTTENGLSYNASKASITFKINDYNPVEKYEVNCEVVNELELNAKPNVVYIYGVSEMLKDNDTRIIDALVKTKNIDGYNGLNVEFLTSATLDITKDWKELSYKPADSNINFHRPFGKEYGNSNLRTSEYVRIKYVVPENDDIHTPIDWTIKEITLEDDRATTYFGQNGNTITYNPYKDPKAQVLEKINLYSYSSGTSTEILHDTTTYGDLSSYITVKLYDAITGGNEITSVNPNTPFYVEVSFNPEYPTVKLKPTSNTVAVGDLFTAGRYLFTPTFNIFDLDNVTYANLGKLENKNNKYYITFAAYPTDLTKHYYVNSISVGNNTYTEATTPAITYGNNATAYLEYEVTEADFDSTNKIKVTRALEEEIAVVSQNSNPSMHFYWGEDTTTSEFKERIIKALTLETSGGKYNFTTNGEKDYTLVNVQYSNSGLGTSLAELIGNLGSISSFKNIDADFGEVGTTEKTRADYVYIRLSYANSSDSKYTSFTETRLLELTDERLSKYKVNVDPDGSGSFDNLTINKANQIKFLAVANSDYFIDSFLFDGEPLDTETYPITWQYQEGLKILDWTITKDSRTAYFTYVHDNEKDVDGHNVVANLMKGFEEKQNTEDYTRKLAYIDGITNYPNIDKLVFDAVTETNIPFKTEDFSSLFKVEYDASNVSTHWVEIGSDLSNIAEDINLVHKFGNVGKDANGKYIEKIRISYTGEDPKYKGLSLTTTLEIIDDRKVVDFIEPATTIEINAADIEAKTYEDIYDVIIKNVPLVEVDGDEDSTNDVDVYKVFNDNSLNIKDCLEVYLKSVDEFGRDKYTKIEDIFSLPFETEATIKVKFLGIYDIENSVKYKPVESDDFNVEYTRYKTEVYFNTNVLHEVEIIYDEEGANLKKALSKDGFIVVYNMDKNPIEEVEFDFDNNITYEPTNLDAAPLRKQQVTVSYGGDNLHQPCNNDVDVRVHYATSKVNIVAENKVFDGEKEVVTITTEPAGLHTASMIAGLEGDGQGYLSLYVDTSTMTYELYKKTGIAAIDDFLDKLAKDIVEINPIFDGYVNDGILYYGDAFINVINKSLETDGFTEIVDVMNQIIQIAADAGVVDQAGDISNLVELITEIENIRSKYNVKNINFRLNDTPRQAGLYVVGAVTLQKNYIPDVTIEYFTITPVKLEPTWDQDLPADRKIVLEDDGTVDFDFGADEFYNTYRDEKLGLNIKDETSYHTFYVGIKEATMPDNIDLSNPNILDTLEQIIKENTGIDFTDTSIVDNFINIVNNNTGLFYISDKPCDDAGAYLEVVIFAGNYEKTMSRTYLITRRDTTIALEDIEKTYGNPNIETAIDAGRKVTSGDKQLGDAIIKFIDLPDVTDINDVIYDLKNAEDITDLLSKLDTLNPFISDEYPTEAETYVMVAYYFGNSTYKPAISIKTLTIHKAILGISWKNIEDIKKEYPNFDGEISLDGYMLNYTYIDHTDTIDDKYEITYPNYGVYDRDVKNGELELTIRNILNETPSINAGEHTLEFILTGSAADNYRIDNGILDPISFNTLTYTILRRKIEIGWIQPAVVGTLSENNYKLTYEYQGQDDDIDDYYYIKYEDIPEADKDGVEITVSGKNNNIGPHLLTFTHSGEYASNYDIDNKIKTEVIDNTLAYEIKPVELSISWNKDWADNHNATIDETGYMLTYTYINHNDKMDNTKYNLTFSNEAVFNNDITNGKLTLTISNPSHETPITTVGVHTLNFILSGDAALNYTINNGLVKTQLINTLAYTILRKDISIGWKSIEDIKALDNHSDFDGKLSNDDYTLTYTYRGQDDCGVEKYYYIDTDAFIDDIEGVTINVYGESKDAGLHDLVFLATGEYASNYDIENHITGVTDNTLGYVINKAELKVRWNKNWADEHNGSIGQLGYMLTYTYIDHNDKMLEGSQYTITYPENGSFKSDKNGKYVDLDVKNILHQEPVCTVGEHTLEFILSGKAADNFKIDNGIADTTYINTLAYTILRKKISIAWKLPEDIKKLDDDYSDFDGTLTLNGYNLMYTYRGQDDNVDDYYNIDTDAFKEDTDGVSIIVTGQNPNAGGHQLLFTAVGKYAYNYDIDNGFNSPEIVDNTLAYEIIPVKLVVDWKDDTTDEVVDDVYKYIYNKQINYLDDKYEIVNSDKLLDDIGTVILYGKQTEAGKYSVRIVLTGTYKNNYYLTSDGISFLGITDLDYEILQKPVTITWKDEAGIVEEDKLTYIYNGEINYLSNHSDIYMFETSDFLDGDKASVDMISGYEVNVGKYEATFGLFGKDAHNYVLATEKLPYEIVPKDITVEWTKVVFDVASNEIKMPHYEFIGLVKNDLKPFIIFEYYDLDGNKISRPSSVGTYLAKIAGLNDDNYVTEGETLYVICDFDSLIENPDYDIVAASINDEVLSRESLVKAKLTECPTYEEAISILSSLDDDTLLNGFTNDEINRIMTFLLEATHLEQEELDEIKPLVTAKYGKGVCNKSFFLNIDLYTMVSGIISKKQVHEPGYEVPITIKISKDSEAAKLIKGRNKLYYVIRVHNGEVDRIPAKCTRDDNGDYLLSFKSDRFSVYGFYCVDKPQPDSYVVPKTGIE